MHMGARESSIPTHTQPNTFNSNSANTVTYLNNSTDARIKLTHTQFFPL